MQDTATVRVVCNYAKSTHIDERRAVATEAFLEALSVYIWYTKRISVTGRALYVIIMEYTLDAIVTKSYNIVRIIFEVTKC